MITLPINTEWDADILIRQEGRTKSVAIRVGNDFHKSTIWTNTKADSTGIWVEFSTVSELIELLDEAFFWEWDVTNPDEEVEV